MWRQRFNADTGIIGRPLAINDRPYQIVGIMPAGFAFPSPDTDLWIPVNLDPRRLGRVRAPCLVIHSTDDDIASLGNVAIVEQKVSAPIEKILLDDSYHMISVDQQRDVVIEQSAGFFRRIAA